MRTYDELRLKRLEIEKERIESEYRELENRSLDYYTRKEIKQRIAIRLRVVENIDEVTKTQIAYHVNLLYDGIKESLKYEEFAKLFYIDFELYIIKVANLSITKDGKFKSEGYWGYNLDIQRAILYFDFTLEELDILIQEDFDTNTRDEFVKFINSKYDTNIPLTQELESAKQKLFEVWFNDKARIIQNKECNLLKARNGEFMKGDEYPLYYQSSISKYFDELVRSLEKSQEQNDSIPTKKLTPPNSK